MVTIRVARDLFFTPGAFHDSSGSRSVHLRSFPAKWASRDSCDGASKSSAGQKIVVQHLPGTHSSGS